MFLIFPVPTCLMTVVLMTVVSDTKWLLDVLHVSHVALYCLVLGLGILVSFLLVAEEL